MGALLVLAFLGFLLMAVLGAGLVLLKLLLFVVLLPLRLVFKLTFGVLHLAFGLLMIPVFLVGLVLVFLVGGLVLLFLPLLPLVLLGLLVWALVHAGSHAAVGAA